MIIESALQLIFRDLFYRLPAFAGKCVFVRNDEEMVSLDLGK